MLKILNSKHNNGFQQNLHAFILKASKLFLMCTPHPPGLHNSERRPPTLVTPRAPGRLFLSPGLQFKMPSSFLKTFAIFQHPENRKINHSTFKLPRGYGAVCYPYILYLLLNCWEDLKLSTPEPSGQGQSGDQADEAAPCFSPCGPPNTPKHTQSINILTNNDAKTCLPDIISDAKSKTFFQG